MTQQLIIAGFHRSGTSMCTQLLHAGGLFVGSDLLGAMPSNPFGHFEDREVIALHQRVFEDNDTSWIIDRHRPMVIGADRWSDFDDFCQRRNAQHRLWGFKDPRVCAFIGAWKHLLPDAKVLIIFRDPADSTYSVERRHARELELEIGPAAVHRRFFEEPDLALRMWTTANEALVAFAEAHRRDVIAIDFASIRSGYPLIKVLNEHWRLGLSDVPTRRIFEKSVTRRRDRRLGVSDARVAHRAMDVWDALKNEERRLFEMGT